MLKFFTRFHENPSLVAIERFVRECEKSLKPGSRVLDAGAGDCRYREIFSAHRYEAADFVQVSGKTYGQIDHVCDLRDIPVEEDRYDAIICTQVLAHLPEPEAALRELTRVLIPGGTLWLSCPLAFQENEKPHDYYRFTRFGLRYLLTQPGLEVVRLEPAEGYLGLLQYQLGMASFKLPLSPRAYGGGLRGLLGSVCALGAKPCFAALCMVYTWIELRHPGGVKGMNINWLSVSRRPA